MVNLVETLILLHLRLVYSVILKKSPSPAICPPIGSQCTPWWPYESVTATAWSSPTSTTTPGSCSLLWPCTHLSWAVRSRRVGSRWRAARWARPRPCRRTAPNSSLIVCWRGRRAKVGLNQRGESWMRRHHPHVSTLNTKLDWADCHLSLS